MGMFDSVYHLCKCGDFVEWQSKVGNCMLGSYNKELVPVGIAKDINNKIEKCIKCGRTYIISMPTTIDNIHMEVKEIKDE